MCTYYLLSDPPPLPFPLTCTTGEQYEQGPPAGHDGVTLGRRAEGIAVELQQPVGPRLGAVVYRQGLGAVSAVLRQGRCDRVHAETGEPQPHLATRGDIACGETAAVQM